MLVCKKDFNSSGISYLCWGNYHPLGKWAYIRTWAQLILLAQLDPLSL